MSTANNQYLPDADERAELKRDAIQLRVLMRRVCPTCKQMGGHHIACPAADEDDDPEAA